MAERSRIPQSTQVVCTEPLGSSFVRVTLGGGDLERWSTPEHADSYVKLVCLVPGVDYPRPLDLGAVRETLPADLLPRLRTYTVRAFDPERSELVLDVLVHGDEGLGGPWAVNARPGDEALLLGPGGAYSPDPRADAHLLAGDPSALPAIAVALERIPLSAKVQAYVEIEHDDDRAALPDDRVVWVARRGAPGTALVEAVRDLDLPAEQVHAFVHGEAGAVKTLRRYLRVERGLTPELLSISGYWRVGVDDEGWRAQKAAWARDAEAQDAEATT